MKVLIFMILVTVLNILNFYWFYFARFHMHLGPSKLVPYRSVFIALQWIVALFVYYHVKGSLQQQQQSLLSPKQVGVGVKGSLLK